MTLHGQIRRWKGHTGTTATSGRSWFSLRRYRGDSVRLIFRQLLFELVKAVRLLRFAQRLHLGCELLENATVLRSFCIREPSRGLDPEVRDGTLDAVDEPAEETMDRHK